MAKWADRETQSFTEGYGGEVGFELTVYRYHAVFKSEKLQ
jgi:hypothetical protein